MILPNPAVYQCMTCYEKFTGDTVVDEEQRGENGDPICTPCLKETSIKKRVHP